MPAQLVTAQPPSSQDERGTFAWQFACLRLGLERHAILPFRYDLATDGLVVSRWVAPEEFVDFRFEHVIERAGKKAAKHRKAALAFTQAVNRALQSDKTAEADLSIDISESVFGTGANEDEDVASFIESVSDGKWWHVSMRADGGGLPGSHSVSGVVVAMGPHMKRELSLRAILDGQNALLASITSDAALALTFDMTTGERITLRSNILPDCVPEDVTLPELIEGLLLRTEQPEGRAELRDYTNIQAVSDALAGKHVKKSFECLMTCPLSKFLGPHWACVTLHYEKTVSTGHPFVLVCLVDVNERTTRELELARQAKHDTLTGLLNFDSFIARCNQLLDTYHHHVGRGASSSTAAAAPEEPAFTFVLIELDDFGRVNDLYGYPYGNRVLKEIAGTLRAFAHERDVSGRLGGTQFGVLMNDVGDEAMVRERVRILKTVITRELSKGDVLTTSIGVAIYPNDGNNFEELHERADDALYVARMSGGNSFVFRSDIEDDEVERKRVRLASLAQPIPDKPLATIRTFNYFDVFVGDKPVVFHSTKSKELLALLVDRQGGFVTSAEAIACLWENNDADKTTLARYRKCAMRLKNTLEEYGIGDIVEVAKGGARRIVPEKVDCDLYRYLSGSTAFENLFAGSYLNNYSWGETTLAMLLRRQDLS